METKLVNGLIALEKCISELKERSESRSVDESERTDIEFRIHNIQNIEKILLLLNAEIKINPSLKETLKLGSNERSYQVLEEIIFIRR